MKNLYIPVPVAIVGISSLYAVVSIIPANRICTKLNLPSSYLLALFLPLIGAVAFIYLAAFSGKTPGLHR